jgi:NLR family CARD domain-containing protein 3
MSHRVWTAASRAATVTVVIATGSMFTWILWRTHGDNTVGYEGKSAAAWLSASGASDSGSRAQAAYALTQVTFRTPAERREALAAEVRLLSDAEEDVRTEATNGLIHFAQQDGDAVGVVSIMAQCLRGDTPLDTRVAALRVLGAIGRPARVAEPTIADLLYASSPAIRRAAIGTLADVGATDSGTVSAIARLGDDQDSRVREAALSALTQLGADASVVLPVVIPALTDTAPSVREQAAYTLGALRPVPDASIVPLAHALWDRGSGVRLAAADALGHALPAPAARDALERAARDPDSAVRAPARAMLVWPVRR